MNQPSLTGLGSEIRQAYFCSARVYRYHLHIIWSQHNVPRLVQFIGLNPSTADEVLDDPTIRRCKAYAKDWGYDGIVMTNLFALRSTDPRPMKQHPQPIGEEIDWKCREFPVVRGVELRNANDWTLALVATTSALTICCWGAHGSHLGRGVQVLQLLERLNVKPFCLTKTQDGSPGHPLYLRKDLKPQPL